MRKRLLTFLVAFLVGTMGTYAQSSLVATLTHGTDISTFFGDNAFIEAYEAASDGDCVTLSSGEFYGCDIAKGIIVRGVGMDNDDELGIVQTKLIMSDKNIALPDGSDKSITIEGINIKIAYSKNVDIKGCAKGVNILKCKLDGFEINTGGGIIHFTHCKTGKVCVNTSTPGEYYFNNSIINYIVKRTDYKYGLHFRNCIFNTTGLDDASFYYGTDFDPEFKNCIFLSDYLPTNSYYCLVIPTASKTFRNISSTNTTNYSAADRSDVFQNMTFGLGHWKDEENEFILSDAAKTTYLGDDGIQVGIFGGANPFSATPTNPRITDFNITTNNEVGQLKVKLNVK